MEVIKINTNDEYDIHDCPLPMLMKRYVETKAVEVLGLHQKGHIFRLVSSILLRFFENYYSGYVQIFKYHFIIVKISLDNDLGAIIKASLEIIA